MSDVRTSTPDLWEEYGVHVYIASLLPPWQWMTLLGTVFYFMHRAIVYIIRTHQESIFWHWSETGRTTRDADERRRGEHSHAHAPPSSAYFYSFSSSSFLSVCRDNGGDDVTVDRVVINTDVDSLQFPPHFLFGVATSAHQIEGGDGGLNQWSGWERAKDAQGRSRIKDSSRVQTGSQHWLRVDDDVKLLKEIGVNAYRFSIEWSKIQPAAGEWNLNAIQHYADEIDQLLRNQIQPMISLQHFTIPTWSHTRTLLSAINACVRSILTCLLVCCFPPLLSVARRVLSPSPSQVRRAGRIRVGSKH